MIRWEIKLTFTNGSVRFYNETDRGIEVALEAARQAIVQIVNELVMPLGDCIGVRVQRES